MLSFNPASLLSIILGSNALVTGPPAESPAPSTAGPESALDADTSRKSAEAERLHSEGRFVEAAFAFEELWELTRQPGFLYNAAATRHAATHLGHAALYLEQYTTLDDPRITPSERDEAGMFLAQVRRDLGVVHLNLKANAPLPEVVCVEAALVDSATSGVRPPLSICFVSDDASTVRTRILYLDRASWTIDAAIEGFETSVFTITPATTPVTRVIDLTKKQPTELIPDPSNEEPKVPRARVIGLSAVGGLALIAGGATFGLAHRNLSLELDSVENSDGVADLTTIDDLCTPSVLEALGDPVADARCQALRHTYWRGIGFGIFGAGLGTITGGLTNLARSRRAREVALYSELAIGAVVTGVSLLGASRSIYLLNEEVHSGLPVGTNENEQQELARLAGSHAVASTFVGFGTGLFFGAGVSLILEAVADARQAKNPDTHALHLAPPSLQISPGGAALSLSGRF